MSGEESYDLVRQPKGRPVLDFTAPRYYQNGDGWMDFKIISDRAFHHRIGCAESCELVKATLPDGESIDLDKLLKISDLKGEYCLSEDGNSCFRFYLKFHPMAVMAASDIRAARACIGEVSQHIKLTFRHTAFEHIPKVGASGRLVPTPHGYLPEGTTFGYKTEQKVPLELVHVVRRRRVRRR